jgi:C_GCAxxG_C_C family probable redox protein
MMKDPIDTAAARLDQGFNCAQSVLAAFAAQLGLDESRALKLASPFGGGVSRRGEVCGAVTGALMVLGLAQGSDTPAGKEKAYLLGQDFLQRFETRHGALLCRKLINCDLGTPEGLQQARSRGVFAALCPLFVRSAAEIAQALLVKRP